MECQQEDGLSLPEEDTEEQRKRCRQFMSISRPGKTCRQPDSPYSYVVCFCGFLCILIAIGCSYSYGLLFPVLLDEFKEGKAKTGIKIRLLIDRHNIPLFVCLTMHRKCSRENVVHFREINGLEPIAIQMKYCRYLLCLEKCFEVSSASNQYRQFHHHLNSTPLPVPVSAVASAIVGHN